MRSTAFTLNWRYLRALSAIVARGSVSAAADAVSVSQPALTQGLRKLETQLGVRLFDRRADGMRATAAGKAMAVRADAALAHLAEGARGGGRRGARGFARPEWLMTATQLHALLALADARSFAAAAAATGLSQPALHRAVRDLEQVCGLPLAERHGRGVVLTRDGLRLARGARLAAGEIAAGIADLTSDPAVAGRIVIGAMPLCRALILPHAIAGFAKGAPRAAIDVREGSWRELVEPLRDGSIDLMIGALRAETPAGLEQRALVGDRLAIVARAGHPLAGATPPTLDALKRYGWIVGHPDTPMRAQWETLFAGTTLPAAPIECGSVMVIRGVLADSDLLTLLSPDQIALEIAGGVLATVGPPLAHGLRTIGITTRASWRPTGAQRRFVELVERAAIETRVPENR